jgi:hypothetical protein
MSKKRIEQLMSELFGFSTQSYFNWKRDAKTKRKIIDLLDIYFSKEMLEEFLNTGKISKLELIKLSETEEFKFTAKERLQELIKFFVIYSTKDLQEALSKSLLENDLNSGTVKYLNKAINKYDFIKIFKNILSDVNNKDDNTEHIFQQVINDFNEKIGFDFSRHDELIVYHIIMRYKVYNTLYGFEDETKK